MNAQILSGIPEKTIIATQEAYFTPVRVIELELGQLLPTALAYDEKTGQHYRRARCLVRLHTQPLGIVELTFTSNELNPQELAANIWRSLAEQIAEHLREDGLPAMSELTEAGVPALATPRCLEARELFLAQAPFVSIIVPTHDRPVRLAACLRFLLALDYPHYEIIIVDNAPTNSMTVDLVQQRYGDEPKVRYVREDRQGPSWARNCGIMVAKGEILAFTDDDVVVDSHWLVELVRGFGHTDNVACVTGLVLPLELETPAQIWFEEYGGFSKGFARRIFDMEKHHPKTPLYPYTAGRFGTGASMAFTSAFLHHVGGFDPALGGNGPSPCGQDIALFFQVIMHGYRLVYEPAALLYHHHRRDYIGLCKQIYNYGIGLVAYLTKIVLDHPRCLLDFITKVPYGVFFALSARSPKNGKKSSTYPSELTRIERKGMLYGPVAYLQSRWALRNVPQGVSSIRGTCRWIPGKGNLEQ